MDIPTNDDGGFELVTDGGEVVGHGVVTDDQVDLAVTDGAGKEGGRVFTRAEFEGVWSTSLRHLTIRPAA